MLLKHNRTVPFLHRIPLIIPSILCQVATRKAFGTALLKLGKNNDRVINVDGDVGNSTFSVDLQVTKALMVQWPFGLCLVQCWWMLRYPCRWQPGM